MKTYIGTTDADLARAEDKAHELASDHDGAKCFHVVEVIEQAHQQGRIYVTDSAGLDEMTESEGHWATPLTSYGVDPDEL